MSSLCKDLNSEQSKGDSKCKSPNMEKKLVMARDKDIHWKK